MCVVHFLFCVFCTCVVVHCLFCVFCTCVLYIVCFVYFVHVLPRTENLNSNNNYIIRCVLTFGVPCCGVRYDFRIITMFVFVASLMSYLRYLCLLVYSGVQHILCFTFFVFVLCTKDRCSTKVKTDRGYTSWIDARQLCSKYVYTGSVLYGDRECIPETYKC
jgi:hypothetical protein